MSFSLIPYFAVIAEAEKTGEPVRPEDITSEMIAEHMPEANPDLKRHFRDGPA
jgi:hypothetical protein